MPKNTEKSGQKFTLRCRHTAPQTAAPVLVELALLGVHLLAPLLGHCPARLDRHADRHGARARHAVRADVITCDCVFGARDFGAPFTRHFLALSTGNLSEIGKHISSQIFYESASPSYICTNIPSRSHS